MRLSELTQLSAEPETKLSDKINHLFGRISVGAIGLDLAKNQANAVQLQYRNGVCSIRAAVSLPYPCRREHLLEDPLRLKAFINDLLKGSDFSGNDIITCVDTNQFEFNTYDYKVNDQIDDARQILELVKKDITTDLSELIIDYIPSRRDTHHDGDRTAIVVTANKNQQLKRLEQLRKAGLYVQRLEVGPIAIKRLIKNIAISQSTPNVLVINTGTENCFFTVLSGRRLLLDRSIVFGQKVILQKLSKSLELTNEQVERLLLRHGLNPIKKNTDVIENLISDSEIRETLSDILKPQFMILIQEIEKVSTYIRSQLQGAEIQRIFLLGSFAYWPGAEVFIGNLLGRKVEVLNPFTSFIDNTPADIIANIQAEVHMAIATGLAMAEVKTNGNV